MLRYICFAFVFFLFSQLLLYLVSSTCTAISPYLIPAYIAYVTTYNFRQTTRSLGKSIADDRCSAANFTDRGIEKCLLDSHALNVVYITSVRRFSTEKCGCDVPISSGRAMTPAVSRATRTSFSQMRQLNASSVRWEGWPSAGTLSMTCSAWETLLTLAIRTMATSAIDWSGAPRRV